MKRLSLAFVLCSTCFMSFAQSDSLNSPEKICDHFFFLMQDNSDNAVDFLFSTNPFFDLANMPQLDEIKGKLNKLFYFGNMHGWDFSSKRELSPNLSQYIYIARYTRQPIKVEFNFYKPDKRWQIQTFRFDEDFKNDFEKVPNQFFNKKQ
ncbi:MAG: hypothetical protein PHI36_04255 [Bacteroidales bacterium]|nr:hypothetical protein [Bacteroidales bacterium]MDD4575624.1 hypothetical protein [Bacteroidales bacterium]